MNNEKIIKLAKLYFCLIGLYSIYGAINLILVNGIYPRVLILCGLTIVKAIILFIIGLVGTKKVKVFGTLMVVVTILVLVSSALQIIWAGLSAAFFIASLVSLLLPWLIYYACNQYYFLKVDEKN